MAKHLIGYVLINPLGLPYPTDNAPEGIDVE